MDMKSEIRERLEEAQFYAKQWNASSQVEFGGKEYSFTEGELKRLVGLICEEQRKICHAEYIDNEGNSERDKCILNAPLPNYIKNGFRKQLTETK